LDENDQMRFTFTGLEPATGNVIITFFHKGDNSAGSFYGLNVGIFSLMSFSATGENTACTDYVESPTDNPVTDVQFNTDFLEGGVLEVVLTFDPDDQTDNTCTGGQMAYVNLMYEVATPMPSMQPSSKPSEEPSSRPSIQPSSKPSSMPSAQPSSMPSMSAQPSFSAQPSLNPSSLTSRFFNRISDVKGLDENDQMRFTFTGLEPAIGNVNITFFHKGDNSDLSFYALNVGVFTLMSFSQSGVDTACTDYVESPTDNPVTDVRFNTDFLEGGVLEVVLTFDPGDQTENTCTDGQMAYVNLMYEVATSMP
jgi:hypothetical protein